MIGPCLHHRDAFGPIFRATCVQIQEGHVRYRE
jgi:hypothetical protein